MFHACIWDSTTGSFQELYLLVFVLAFWNRILDTISMFRSLLCTVILAVLETTHSSPNADNNDICTDTQRDNSYFRAIVRNSDILYRRDGPKLNVRCQDQQPNIDENHKQSSLLAYLFLIDFARSSGFFVLNPETNILPLPVNKIIVAIIAIATITHIIKTPFNP